MLNEAMHLKRVRLSFVSFYRFVIEYAICLRLLWVFIFL